jgi:hypothetical protein
MFKCYNLRRQVRDKKRVNKKSKSQFIGLLDFFICEEAPQYFEHFSLKLLKIEAQLSKSFKLLESFYSNTELLLHTIIFIVKKESPK